MTGRHDRPLHYLGIHSCAMVWDPASRIRTGDIAVAAQLPNTGRSYYSRALYQSELRRDLRSYYRGNKPIKRIDTAGIPGKYDVHLNGQETKLSCMTSRTTDAGNCLLCR